MRTLAAFSLIAAMLVSGCGNGGYGGSSGAMAAPQAPKPATSVAAAAPSGPAVRMATVDIASFMYKPVVVVVRKGGRIRWTNSDDAAHTATADDRSFDTQTIDRGKSSMVTLTTGGTFAYHCDFHPFMKATVVVK
jgi:plastocyanin